jgi:hypothetical protein
MAINLAIYTEQKCNNEKICPKRLRWCSTNDMILYAERTAVEIKLANKANLFQQYERRREHQCNANEYLESMLTKLDLIRKRNTIQSKTLEYWVCLINELQDGLRAWAKADSKRYKQYLQENQSLNG